MASVSITRRRGTTGTRYVVRYRLGGRAYPIVHGGSFKTEREARERQKFIGGELAAGRNPAEALRALLEVKPRRTFLAASTDFRASRIDVGIKAQRLYKNAEDRAGKLGDLEPEQMAPGDFQTWIADNSNLSPKTLGHYLSTYRQVLDFCGVTPNPRSGEVREAAEADRGSARAALARRVASDQGQHL
jgi:hypothetical protein